MLYESHRLTQRWEASLWLEGRQLYLGGFQTELDAARAYDIAALSCKGPHVQTNYPEESYAQELQETAGCSTVCLPLTAPAVAAYPVTSAVAAAAGFVLVLTLLSAPNANITVNVGRRVAHCFAKVALSLN